jgi:hypothetical protein
MMKRKKRENMPLKVAELMALELLRLKEWELLSSIIEDRKLDPSQLGKEYKITPTAIVFEEVN